MILHDYVLSASCYKVRLMCALSGAPVTLKAVNFHPQKEHKSDVYLKLNPAGTLPILEDDGKVFTQSSDMLKHVARKHGAEWLGDENDVSGWLSFAANLNDSLGMARLHDILSYEADIQSVRAAGMKQLRILEAHLSGQRFDGHAFLTGDRPTIADIACFPNVALAPDGGVSIDVYPAIRLWTRAIRALPGFIEMPGIHRLHELSPMPDLPQ